MKQFLILFILVVGIVAQAAPTVPPNRWAMFRMTYFRHNFELINDVLTWAPITTWYFRNLSPTETPYSISYTPGMSAALVFRGGENAIAQFFNPRQNPLPQNHPIQIRYNSLVDIADPNNTLLGFIRDTINHTDNSNNEQFRFMQSLHRVYPNIQFEDINTIMRDYERLLDRFISLEALGWPDEAAVRNQFRTELRRIGIQVPRHPEEPTPEPTRGVAPARAVIPGSGGGSSYP